MHSYQSPNLRPVPKDGRHYIFMGVGAVATAASSLPLPQGLLFNCASQPPGPLNINGSLVEGRMQFVWHLLTPLYHWFKGFKSEAIGGECYIPTSDITKMEVFFFFNFSDH